MSVIRDLGIRGYLTWLFYRTWYTVSRTRTVYSTGFVSAFEHERGWARFLRLSYNRIANLLYPHTHLPLLLRELDQVIEYQKPYQNYSEYEHGLMVGLLTAKSVLSREDIAVWVNVPSYTRKFGQPQVYPRRLWQMGTPTKHEVPHG